VTADGVQVTFHPEHYAVTDPDRTHYYLGLTPPDLETGQEQLFISSHYSRNDANEGGSVQEELCTGADVFFRWFLTGVLQAPDSDKLMDDARVRAACFDALGASTTFLATTPSGKTVKVTFGGDPHDRANFLMFPVVRDENGQQRIQIGDTLVTLSQLSINIQQALQERYPDKDFSYVLAAAGGGLTLPSLPEEAPAYIPPTPTSIPSAETIIDPAPVDPAAPEITPLVPLIPEVMIPPAGELTLHMTFDAEAVKFQAIDDQSVAARVYDASQSMLEQGFTDALDVARIPRDRLWFIPIGEPYLKEVDFPSGELALTVSKIAYNDPAGNTITIAGKTSDGRFVLMHFDLSDKYVTTTPGTFQMYREKDGQIIPYLTLTFATKNADGTASGSTLPESVQAYFEYIINANEFMKAREPFGYIVTPKRKANLTSATSENEAKQIMATHQSDIPYIPAYIYSSGPYDRFPQLIPIIVPTDTKVAIKQWVYNQASNMWYAEVEINPLDTTSDGFRYLQSNTGSDGLPLPEIANHSLITVWIPEANLAMINLPPVAAPSPQSALPDSSDHTLSYFHSQPETLTDTTRYGIPHPGQVLAEIRLHPVVEAVQTILHDLSLGPEIEGTAWYRLQQKHASRARA
jgi:hypothetical protein